MEELVLLDYQPLFMFVVLLGLICSGFPVAFTLMGTALIFGVIGHFTEYFYLSDFGFLPSRIWGIMNKITLTAVPLFIFMGITLEKAGIAEDLLLSTEKILKRIKGSLLFTVIIVGAVLAASTGIVGASVVTMGVLALPTLLKRGFSKELSCGTIAASGTLGQIIPPSIVLVLLGEMMQVDVGDLFTGALIPGLILVGLYMTLVAIYLFFGKKHFVEAPMEGDSEPLNAKELLSAIVPPVVLMVVVLGSILFGLASPTEAAACGAFMALVIAAVKKKLNKEVLKSVMQQTASITGMVFMLLIGAQFFGVVFRGLGGDDLINTLVLSNEMSQTSFLIFVMILIFILGFFLDFLEICFILIPMLMPIFMEYGVDKLWLAILIAINLQTSFLTPPFGFSLFYLKGVAPPEVKTSHIYRGIIPFVICQIVLIGLVSLFPSLVTWLPKVVFGEG